ncbi:hypothetical protein NLX69_00550 [Rossellomorea sp. BNER]|nr:hypothetical protein [Rossellomorea sp. BNER]
MAASEAIDRTVILIERRNDGIKREGSYRYIVLKGKWRHPKRLIVP